MGEEAVQVTNTIYSTRKCVKENHPMYCPGAVYFHSNNSRRKIKWGGRESGTRAKACPDAWK